MKKVNTEKRSNAALTVFSCIIAIYCLFLAVTVLTQSADGNSAVSKYEVVVEAARGELFDRNGALLVSNRQGNSIKFNASVFPPQSKAAQRNEIIKSLIELCESKNEEWTDNLPIIFDENGNIVFQENRDSDIKALKAANMLNLNSYATAENCLDALIDMYKLEDYDKVTARKIASVRYEMWRTGYSEKTPYTFAQDISNETISVIKEKNDFFKGVEVQVETYREYEDGTLAPHVIGITGIISDKEYENRTKELEEDIANGSYTESEIELKRINAYKLTDFTGKFGIESAMESYLRGTKGIKSITVDSENNVTSEFVKNPKPGAAVYLTIDSGLQRVAQNSLQKRITELLSESNALAPAGAVVVVDVHSGEILASATYPSYDLTQYYEKYNELMKASGSPLVNRVLQSTYEPGSTMKLATAIAGLESKTITKADEFYCDAVYQYFDVTFSCLDKHGSLNVVSALEKSCNLYFYNVAEKLGIDVMNDYASKLGLGKKTGVELTESSGILAGRAYRDSIGSTWQMGDTIQAAIGQSDNLFTIIQLANYCATIANGGTRYKCHYVKHVMSSDHNELLLEVKPEIVEETGISKESIDIVKEGMLAVTTTGSAATAMAGITEKVGMKTGTTQVKRVVDGKVLEGNNGLNISFAPFDKPEIAVAVIIENINSGTATATVAADIYNYYFSTKNQISSSQQTNQLLR